MTQQQTILKGRDIVIISIQPWYYELGSNCKNIATHFAGCNRVLYVNIPITRKTFYSKNNTKGVEDHCAVIKNKTSEIKQLHENMWELYPTTLIESINWLPSTTLFKLINKINNKRFADDIKKAIDHLHFKDIILFNDNDIYNGFHLKELLSPSLYIYYMRDFLQGYPFWEKHSSVLEPQLIKKADLVITNSIYYTEYCKQFNQHTGYMGQGCKLDQFNKNKINSFPEETQLLQKPIIGYVGALDSARLDHQIIRLLAQAKQNWQIVLVGPEDTSFLTSDLHQFPNIHFLGRRPMEQLPTFVNSFDVCINPQLINLITTGNYPLKIDEYLAIGKPVVATRTKAMKLFEEYTYLADTPEDYPALVEKALLENTPQKEAARIQFAQSHTWENSMISLYGAIKEYEQANRGNT
jgi:glycosyltransferase involved in cell wall biosynthesis